jgi:hypothetical protein
MIKKHKINILNALRIRKVDFPANHFIFIKIKKYNVPYLISLDKWIYENLNGRYYIGYCIDLVDNSLAYSTKIGFENEKEVSFFKIACPHI